MELYSKRLEELRYLLDKHGLHGFIIPMNDEFQGEYIPPSAKRLEWLTGFDGSNGLAIVLKDKAAFFTDGRYTLQAKKQVPGHFLQFNMAEIAPWKWVVDTLKGGVLGFDPWLHTEKNIINYSKLRIDIKTSPNLIDLLWQDRPQPPQAPAKIHELRFAGEAAEGKRQKLAAYLREKGQDALLLTAPDSVCWLLNIRGNDVPRTPFVLCYALVKNDASVDLFVDEKKIGEGILTHLGKDVRITSISALDNYFNNIKNKTKIQVDPGNTPVWFMDKLRQAGAGIKEESDPCQLWKSCKNKTEIEGAYAAHQRDGAALTQFLCWLDAHLGKEEITELSAAATLETFRAKNDLFQDLSFDTIAGFKEHGAIVHYRATEKSSKRLEENGIFLLDSGAQYVDGTTDVTRTIALGAPTQEQKDNFTRVLKGHIALARAVFPEGTTGSQLDALARYPLWQVGLDYDHGTGHGVGSYLSVHEGPQRISKVANMVALQPGMIISNEPGYYKAGEYGIRIENLVIVVEKPEFSGDKRYFGFDTLTRAPIDMKLVNTDLLAPEERDWLAAYHQQLWEDISPLVDEGTRRWLEERIDL